MLLPVVAVAVQVVDVVDVAIQCPIFVTPELKSAVTVPLLDAIVTADPTDVAPHSIASPAFTPGIVRTIVVPERLAVLFDWYVPGGFTIPVMS